MTLKITCNSRRPTIASCVQIRGLLMAGCGKSDARKRPPSQPAPRVQVADLLGGGREAVLVHEGAEYRLRLTSNGKLILTK